MIEEKKLKAANETLEIFAPGSKLLWIPGRGLHLEWKRGENTICRRYQLLNRSSHYPIWHKKWPHGGTACLALFQLVRWLQDKPCLSIRQWRYWAGNPVRLGDHRMVDILLAAGYPEAVECVFCGRQIVGQFDWFNDGSLSGPGHWDRICQKL